MSISFAHLDIDLPLRLQLDLVHGVRVLDEIAELEHRERAHRATVAVVDLDFQFLCLNECFRTSTPHLGHAHPIEIDAEPLVPATGRRESHVALCGRMAVHSENGEDVVGLRGNGAHALTKSGCWCKTAT